MCRGHYLGRCDSCLCQPVGREVTAANARILGHVARDIGELKRKAKVTGAVERLLICRVHAHDDCHHAPHNARDVVAIAHQIRLAPRSPPRCVKGESGDMVAGETVRQAGFARDNAQSLKRRFARCLTRQCAVGQGAQPLQPRFGVSHHRHAMAMVLPIGQIVACPAPAIKQPCPFAHRLCKQGGGGGKAFRSARDRQPGCLDNRVARHKSRAPICWMVVMGAARAIRSSSVSSVSATIISPRCCGRIKPTSPILAAKAINPS